MNLKENIDRVLVFLENDSGNLLIQKDYFDPIFWVLLLSQKRKNITIEFEWKKNLSFANTIGLIEIIDPGKSFKINRYSEGRTYSKIQKIDSQNPSSVETANSGINECMRKVLQDYPFLLGSQSAHNILHTVMELHDNVASHSESIGFSFFQLREGVVYFCISDSGKGFLSEVRKHGIPGIMSHKESILWSLTKGNSTKKLDDEFAQMLPEDAISNPMKSIATFRRKADGNNHMGFGLYILKSFCLDSGGRLEIATGDSIYTLSSKGEENFDFCPKIVGVTISMSVNLSQARAKLEKLAKLPEILPSIKWEVQDE